MFGCLPAPGGAVEQEPTLIDAIREYRTLKTAIAWANDTEHGGVKLQQNPGVAGLLREMFQAQLGIEVTTAEAVKLAQDED